jgi:SRSO17 transposase
VRRGFRAKRGPLLSPEPKNLLAIAQSLPASAWKKVTWRQGTKGPQRSRFATLSLWAAHGWKQGPPPERVEETVLIEWPQGEPAPTRYWLACLPKKRVALAKLVATAKARWRVEQDYRELKDELGLDHYEGRSWQGFHHHVALVTAAFVFLRQEQGRLRRRAQKKSATAHAAAGAPQPASRPHPPERSLPLVSHPLPPA